MSFYSDRLSDSKLKEITDFAVLCRHIKNELSEVVNKDPLRYIQMSKFDFQKEFRELVKSNIPSSFYIQLMDDVYLSYSNKFDQIKNKFVFKKVSDIKCMSNGEIKNKTNTKIDTVLSRTLTYLAREGDENILVWLPLIIEKKRRKEDKKFYTEIFDCINKFGIKRLSMTSESKRNRLLKKYFGTPLVFKSLTFRGMSRLTRPTITYNKDFRSTIKAFINISWVKFAKELSIPIKYSKNFHGKMKQYQNKTETSYKICVSKKGVRVILSCEKERDYPENKTNFVGVDVNTKHNLLQCSDNSYVDYDRRLFCVLANELKKTDEIKSQNKEYVVGTRRTNKISHLRRELVSNTRTRISEFCKELKTSGYDHVVFENLDKSFGRKKGKTEYDINQNRLMSELHICSIKDEFEHIARKYDIATSFVHPEYTSQTCSKCGCVESENRENQEEFKCVECGYKCNADLNASMNIRNRVASTVLRSELLQKTSIGNGTYEPKSLSRDKVKEVLLSFRKRPYLNGRLDKEFNFNLFR